MIEPNTEYSGVVRVAFKAVYYHSQSSISKHDVEHVWPQGDRLPLLNLSNGETSVPHSSAVTGASCGFWTFTEHGDETDVRG